MTDSWGQFDKSGLEETSERLDNQIEAQTAHEQAQNEQREVEAAENQQLVAEQNDPRNAENWGLKGVVKELQSAFGGGVQDTASSIATLGERVLDTASGEIQRESQTKEGYNTEWDDWFVDDENPIETKTWWGGLIRSATHFGTMGLAVVKAAPVLGVGATAVGAGRLVTATGSLVANQWARAAAVGAATDLVSKYSQDANALQTLRDKYGFIDTPLTTNDMDHPTVKTLKNVVEGMGIGEIANGVFRIMGKGVKRIRPGRNIGSEVVDDAAEEGVQKAIARSESVQRQKLEKAEMEMLETPNEIRGAKNDPITDSWQDAPTSVEKPYDVKQSQKRTRNEWGAEEGSPGSVTTPVELERVVRNSGYSEEVVTNIFRDLVSDVRFRAEMADVKLGRKTMVEVWGDAVEQLQRTGLGREAADQTPGEFLAEYYSSAHRMFADSPDEMVVWTAKNVVAGDLLKGSLVKEIRDLGIAGRELADIADLADVDGPAKALYDKLITVLTETKKTRLVLSDEFRNLGARSNDPTEVAEATLKQKAYIDQNLSKQVGESIDAFRTALKLADDDMSDDMFKAIFETVSMSKELHNLTDFDNFVRKKLKGGSFKGGPKEAALWIKELQGVMVNSILSGPKTPMRAILGTGTATFMRPMSTAAGAFLRGDAITMRASLASMNAMRESLPEAWKLFKTRLNSYWAGDVSTVKSRYSEYTKGDEQWDMFGNWIENSGQATLGDQAAFYIANQARQLNENKFLTYSTKIMAATDDTFGYVLSRAKAREKAMREALEANTKGDFTEITPELLRDSENRFLSKIIDADGNILDDAVEFAKREATLTTDLQGFSKGLQSAFEATPWAKPFFLFARTGVNGLTLTAKHTPGFNFLVDEFNDIARATANNLDDVAKYGINSVEELANAKALQTGRLAIGGSVISMAGMHFMNGGLTGNGPTDRQKRQVWMDAGYIPRSIKIGDVWVGYDAFEPFNQILSAVADVGDHTELMGEEWTKDNFQKLSLVLMQAATSKSYLQGLQQLVDLLAGEPGQQQRIIGGLMNNQVPMAGLRNDVGKLFTPHMKELSKSWVDAIRNRNLWAEGLSSEPLSIKYDLLNGTPIREHDFPTRMWNTFIPVPLNMDQSPGRQLLFDSGFDIRMSTYYAPDGTDLTDSPRLRSKFQEYIGRQNLEIQLNKLARDPRVQASLNLMNDDRRRGLREIDPMKAYHHNKLIKRLFKEARQVAWAQMKQDSEVQQLILEERRLKVQNIRKLKQSQEVSTVLQIAK